MYVRRIRNQSNPLCHVPQFDHRHVLHAQVRLAELGTCSTRSQSTSPPVAAFPSRDRVATSDRSAWLSQKKRNQTMANTCRVSNVEHHKHYTLSERSPTFFVNKAVVHRNQSLISTRVKGVMFWYCIWIFDTTVVCSFFYLCEYLGNRCT